MTRCIDSATAAKNGRRGKAAWEQKAANTKAGLTQDGKRIAPLRPIIVKPRMCGQGGKPYIRPGSLDPWPALKKALLGGSDAD